MTGGGYGGPTGPYDGDPFAADPYPQPPIISAPPPSLVTTPIRSPPCRWYSHSSSPLWAWCSAISGWLRSGAPGNGATTGR